MTRRARGRRVGTFRRHETACCPGGAARRRAAAEPVPRSRARARARSDQLWNRAQRRPTASRPRRRSESSRTSCCRRRSQPLSRRSRPLPASGADGTASRQVRRDGANIVVASRWSQQRDRRPDPHAVLRRILTSRPASAPTRRFAGRAADNIDHLRIGGGAIVEEDFTEVMVLDEIAHARRCPAEPRPAPQGRCADPTDPRHRAQTAAHGCWGGEPGGFRRTSVLMTPELGAAWVVLLRAIAGWGS
jgi:hypothetical protein